MPRTSPGPVSSHSPRAAAPTARAAFVRGSASLLAACLLAVAISAAANGGEPVLDERSRDGPHRTVTRPARRIQAPGLKVSLERMMREHVRLGRLPVPEKVPIKKVYPPPRQVPGVEPGDGRVPNIPPPPAAGSPIEGATAASTTPPLLQSFPGMEHNLTYIPPDTTGAIGPSHFVSVLNIGFAIYDRATGAPLFGPISHQAFWAPLGTGPNQPANIPFDPKIVFDHYSGRFVITADGGNGSPRITPSWVLLAVSDDSDPTLGWTLYAVRFDTPMLESEWADYPDLGVGPDQIIVTNNAYEVSGSAFTKARIMVVDKAAALAGTLDAFEFRDATGGVTWRSATATGTAEASYIIAENWTAGGTTRLLRIQEIKVDSGTPYMLDLGFIQVSDYGFDTGGPLFIEQNAPQAGCEHTIEPVFPRLMNAVFRSGRIWTTHSVGDPVTDGIAKNEIAWYEIDPGKATLGPPFAVPEQQGRITHPDRWYYFPSIAVNAEGSMALGFSGSSPTEFVGTYYVTREHSDPPGTLGTLELLKAGEAPYTYKATSFGDDSRWGDYSLTTVDPVDGLTFWTIQEYAKPEVAPGCPTADTGRFGTWIGSFRPQPALLPPDPSGCEIEEIGGSPGWTHLQAPRSHYEGPAGVAIGNRIYLTHGEAPYRGLTADNNIYDRSTGLWGQATPASVPRRDAAGACVEDPNGQGILFVVGGASASGPLADLELYDPVADAWQTGPPMPVARRGAAAVHVPGIGVDGGSRGSVFVIGGSDGTAPGNGNALDLNRAFDVETATWVSRAPLPFPVMDLSAVLLPQSGEILVSGGFDGASSRNDILLYDPAADAWSSASPMPTARSGHALGLCGGKVFAVGGAAEGGETAANESYDPVSDAWYAAEPAMPVAGSGMAGHATGTGSEIFVIGTTAAAGGSRYGINDLFTCGAIPDCQQDADCDDGVACNGDEICETPGGRCGPGPQTVCLDGNPCTADICQPATPLLETGFDLNPEPGWTHAPRGGADTWHQSRSGCFGANFPSVAYVNTGTLGSTCEFSSSNEGSQLLGPPVQLPGSGPIYLELDAFSSGASGACTTSGQPDSQDVGITTDGGATYTILNDCYPLGSGTTPTHHLLDISAFAGQEIQVIFVFDGTDPASIAILFGVDNVRIHVGDQCLHPALPDGSPCPDTQFCNGDESCLGGACAAAAPAVCDDADACTVDTCDAGANSCAFAGPFDSETAPGDDALCGTGDDNPPLFGPDALCGTGDDLSGDGTCDELDNCVARHNPGQENADGDPRGDACDCLPSDDQTWSIPGGAEAVGFSDDQTLVWNEPSEPGAVSVAYDTLRSASPWDFGAAAVCVESLDAWDTMAVDLTVPAPGQVLNYLVRPVTPCGFGPIGSRFDGTPRSGRTCP